MKPTLIVTAVANRLSEPTEQCVRRLMNFSDEEEVRFTMRGASNVTLARCMNYTHILNDARAEELPPETPVLTIDDDVVFTVEGANALVAHTRETGRPCSGVYATAGGTLHAARDRGIKWECGLGFTVFTIGMLEAMAERMPLLSLGPNRIWPFCQSGVHPTLPTDFTSEDYWFCRELGGVDLLPVPVGHLKTFPIWPDGETLERVQNDDVLEERAPTVVGLSRPLPKDSLQ